jgi:hypothetical protein
MSDGGPPGGVSLNERDFEYACGVIDDDRSLIAAGKTQRWEVLKWAVTVNVAIAALLSAHRGAGGALVFLAFFIAAIGIALIQHYNSRMTAARDEADGILSLFNRSGINLDLIQPSWRDYRSTTGTCSETVGMSQTCHKRTITSCPIRRPRY